jgi:putative transposase
MATIYNKRFKTVFKLTVHLVLVVKYRKKAINKEMLNRLREIFDQTLNKWDCKLIDFNGESDHVHLILEFMPHIKLSDLIGNLKTVSSRLIRKEFPNLQNKYFYGKPSFWTGSYFVASCGGVTLEQLKQYVANQETIN